jgi:hypothetical protein
MNQVDMYSEMDRAIHIAVLGKSTVYLVRAFFYISALTKLPESDGLQGISSCYIYIT